MPEKTIHEGRNVKRICEMLGIKQEALASELGDDWNQRRISMLEAKETIEPQLLEEVAKALKVPAQAIKNFDEESAVTYFNTFHDNSINQGANFNYQCTINPLEKYVEQVEENKKLYERLLKEKEAMIEELKKLLNKGN
jgi:transcriptional regulator with XRE-family HTH domain